MTTATDSASIAIEGVSRSFSLRGGVFTALQSVNLEMEPDSFTVIVGPSGCGKSTLLNMIAGLETTDSGTIRITPEKSTLAYLFQQPRLLPWLSALDNISLILRTRGTPRAAADEQARGVLALVGLKGFEGHYPGYLSGGMQQRVALARALVVNPSLMLMDEPFSALDALTAEHLRRELLSIYDSQPRTVVFVTHNIAEACELADRVIVMATKPGRVVADIAIPLQRPRDVDSAELRGYSRRILSLIENPEAEENG